MSTEILTNEVKSAFDWALSGLPYGLNQRTKGRKGNGGGGAILPHKPGGPGLTVAEDHLKSASHWSSNSSVFFILEYSGSLGWGPNPRLNQLLSELHCENSTPEEEVSLLLAEAAGECGGMSLGGLVLF